MEECTVAKQLLANRICNRCVYYNTPGQDCFCDKKDKKPEFNTCLAWISKTKIVDKIMRDLYESDSKITVRR